MDESRCPASAEAQRRAAMGIAGADSIVLPKSEFADFANLLGQMQTVGGDAVLRAANSDRLALAGVNKTTLATLGADFSFASVGEA
jgi:hypothetical protein